MANKLRKFNHHSDQAEFSLKSKEKKIRGGSKKNKYQDYLDDELEELSSNNAESP